MRSPVACRIAAAALLCLVVVTASAQTETAAQSAAAKKERIVGTIKSINANTLIVATDSGSDVSVTIAPTTRMVRMEPGQTDLKSAPTVQLSDVQAGDRILAQGMASEGGKALAATTAVIMKKLDVAEKQQREREQWRTNGVGGVVKSVDASAGTVTLSTGTLDNNALVLHMSQKTTIRRYAPDSVRFEDANPGTLDQIKPGDQLRALGTKSEDGKELSATEIVSGTFRSIPATVVSTDAATNRVTVTDLVTRHPVTLKVGQDSQMRQLPAMFAQAIAMRLRGAEGGGSAATPAKSEPARGASGEMRANGMGTGRHGPPDFQQMLNRMPPVALADLQKGDALMIVATEGTAETPSTSIVLVKGAEPILAAASPAQASTILSPWNLSSANAGTGDTP